MLLQFLEQVEWEWLFREGLTLRTISKLVRENRRLLLENNTLKDILYSPLEKRLQKAVVESVSLESRQLAMDSLGEIAKLKSQLLRIRQRAINCPRCSSQIDTPPVGVPFPKR